MKKPPTSNQKREYEKIIEKATMDCYGEYEQIAGWICLLDEKIGADVDCLIGNEKAVLENIDSDDNGNVVVGVLRLNKTKSKALIQNIAVDDPKAMQYINAYKYWCTNGY